MRTSLLTSELEDLLDLPYDPPLAFDLYMMNRPTELVYCHLLPIVSIVFKKIFRSLETDRQEEVMADAADYLYFQLLRRTYHPPAELANPGHFTTWWFYVVRRAMYKSLSDLQEFTFPPFERHDLPARPRPIHPLDMEYHIYLEQLPRLLRDVVEPLIRLESPQDRQACLYVLDRMLEGCRIVPAYIKNELNIRDPQFIVSYMVVLMRSTLHRMKIDQHPCFLTVFSTKYVDWE